MIPDEDFPQANAKLSRPSDLADSQCQSMKAYFGEIKSGSCDGGKLIITAWKPSPEELKDINDGKPIYLCCLNGIPPHFLCTDFELAHNPI